MDSIELMHPRLVGERFRGGTLPLDMLQDLAVLQEMIIEIAKWQYLQKFGDRQRVPRGFASKVELRLTALEDGSAKLTLAAFILSSNLLSPEMASEQAYLKSAPQAILETIQTASAGGVATDKLPKKLLSYFNRFGRNLREGEQIEFASATQASPVVYTPEIRRRVLQAAQATHITEDARVRALVPEADQDKQTFTLILDGRRVEAPMEEALQDAVLEAFRGFKTQQWVEIRGVARKDARARIVSFEEVHHVDLLDPLDVGVQLDALRKLKDGWLDGKGVAPSSQGLDWLTQWFEDNYPSSFPLPHLYPTPEGEIQAEWSLGTTEVTLVIHLRDKQAWWHALDLDTDADSEQPLNLIESEGAKWLIDQLRQLNGGEDA